MYNKEGERLEGVDKTIKKAGLKGKEKERERGTQMLPFILRILPLQLSII